MNVGIKTKTGERDSITVAIYTPIFGTGSTEALLKVPTIMNKIIKGKYLSTGF